MFNSYFKAVCVLFVVLAISYFLDVGKGFSLTYWWWDSYEHFLGGFMVGFFALWMGSLKFKRTSILQCVFFVLLIGLLWEGIEVVYPTGESIWFSYGFDTTKDIVLDVLGAIVAWHVGERMRS